MSHTIPLSRCIFPPLQPVLLPSFLPLHLFSSFGTPGGTSLAGSGADFTGYSAILYAKMASPALKKAISEAALTYVKPEGKVFQYGTAGVRFRLPEWSFLRNNG